LEGDGAVKHLKSIIALLTPVLFCPAIQAETLSAMLTRVYNTHPDIQTAIAQVRARAESLPQARADFLPTLGLAANEGRSRIRQDTRDRASGLSTTRDLDETTTDRSLALELSLDLYQGGARSANLALAEAQTATAVADLDHSLAATLFNAIQAYANVMLYRELVRLNGDIEQFLIKLAAESDDLFANRLITLTDRAQTRASLAATRSDRASLQGSLAQAESDYLTVSSAPPDVLRTASWDTLLPALPATLHSAQTLALQANPALRAARLTATAAGSEVQVARGQLRPTLSATSRLSRSWDKSRFTSAADYTELGREDEWSVGLQLQVPLFRGGRDYAQVREAQANLSAAKSQARSTSLSITNALASAWAQHQAALAQRTSIAEEIRAYRDTLDGFERQLRDGTSTMKDLLDARTALDQALESQVSTAYQALIAQAQILGLIGQLTAADLGLAVTPFDSQGYIEQTRGRLFGTEPPAH
jgi:outer membrane protein